MNRTLDKEKLTVRIFNQINKFFAIILLIWRRPNCIKKKKTQAVDTPPQFIKKIARLEKYIWKQSKVTFL